MKRIFSVILVLLLLSGCGIVSTKVEPVTKGLTFSCDITYYNETYSCNGDIHKNGDMEIEFISPADLEGLKYTFTDKGVAVNFNEIEYISQKIVFESSAASFINEVLQNCDTTVMKHDDIFYTEGTTTDFEYKLELGATGLPIKITTRPDAVLVVFKNVKIQ